MVDLPYILLETAPDGFLMLSSQVEFLVSVNFLFASVLHLLNKTKAGCYSLLGHAGFQNYHISSVYQYQTALKTL